MHESRTLPRLRLPRPAAVMLAVLTVLAVIAAGYVAAASPPARASDSVAPGLPDWANPPADAMPMARSWWPDAGAGRSAAGLAMTAQHVDDMAKAGYGGMEIAFLSDQLTSVPQSSTLPTAQQLGQPGVDQNMAQTSPSCCLDFSNAQAASVGYGTENWQKILTQIYQTANSEKNGFVIDLTLSQHWPVAFNNIDPNGAGQMQAAKTAYSAITAADVAAGSKDLPAPPQRLWDLDNVPFVFADHYQATTILKVASVSASGTPTFSYASLTDASAQTTRKINADGSPAGHAAGIMDSAWINANPSTFTGTLTAGSTTISNLSSTNGAQRQAGSILSGPGVPDGTEVVSVGTNSLVMSNAATSSSSGASIAAKWNINTVNADWGPDPVNDPDGATFKGKIDAEGNRRRMADWQYAYQTSISAATLSNLGCTVPAPGAALAAGDCVLFGTWSEGTGQTRSGGVNTVQHNREYVTSIYNREATQALIDFWENNILGTWKNGVVTQRLGDTKLLQLIRANARAHPQDAVFEDSLEFSKPSGSGNYWTGEVLSEMSSRLGYDAAKYAPVLAGGSAFDSITATGLLPSGRVTEDWTATLGQDVATDHVAAVQDWAKSTLGYNFKMQDIGGTGVQHAQLATGTHEDSCDGGCADNGRDVSAAAALTGSNWVSAETLTSTRDYINPWLDDIKILNQDYAAGINRPQWHGTPYMVTFNGANSAWPGWEFQHGSPVGWGAFDRRQAYWGDIHELTGYVARTQSALQAGVAKADLLVLRGTNQSYSAPSSSTNSLQGLMDAGWTYQLGDDRMLTVPNAVVQDGLLDPYGPTNGLHDGPAYKAVVVSGATELKVATVQKLAEYADAGLPIIFFNSTVSRVYGTNLPGGDSTSLNGNNDTALAAALATLQAKPDVYAVGSTSSPATQAQLISQLQSAGLASNASYSAPGLETVQRESNGREYYYLYNANASGSPLTATVSLKGSGQPYILDAYTGNVEPIANYTSAGGRITTTASLAPRDTTIIETSPDGSGLHATSTSGGQVRYTAGHQLALRVTQAGDYSVTLSNGNTTSVHVGSVPAAVDLSTGWGLELQSWGPDPSATDPTSSAKTTTSFAANALGSWSNLPATSAQLAALGVSSMSQVSGIGFYSTTLQLPNSWRADADGALLSFTHGTGDMVVAVTINGRTIDTIDQVTSSVDAGPYLHAGTNTIVVKLDTNLGNRVGRTTQSYGLTGVTFTPYTEVPVG